MLAALVTFLMNNLQISLMDFFQVRTIHMNGSLFHLQLSGHLRQLSGKAMASVESMVHSAWIVMVPVPF